MKKDRPIGSNALKEYVRNYWADKKYDSDLAELVAESFVNWFTDTISNFPTLPKEKQIGV